MSYVNTISLFSLASYWLNPQYYVRLVDVDENDEDEECTLVVSLMQKYARARRTTEKSDTTDTAIGFDIYKVGGLYREVSMELVNHLHYASGILVKDHE